MVDYQGELAELLPENTTLPREGIGINVKRLIKLRSRLMFLTFLAVALPVVALIVLLVPRPFVATARIAFDPIAPSILDAQGRELGGAAYENYVNSQAQLLTSYTMLRRVLAHEDVQGLHFAQRPNAIAYLMRHMDAQVQRNTVYVEVKFRDEDRAVALLTLNTLLGEYVKYNQEQEMNRGDLRRRTLEETRGEMQQNLERQLEEVAAARTAAGLPAGEQASNQSLETEQYRINFAQAQSDYTTAQTTFRQAQNLVEQIRSLLSRNQANPGAPVFSHAVEERVQNSPHVTLLLQQLAQAEQEFSALQENYVDTAPQVEIAQSNLAALQRRVEAAKGQARQEALRATLAEAEYDVTLRESLVQDAQERRDQFQALLEDYLQQDLSRSRERAVIAEQERLIEYTQQQIAQIDARLVNLDIESNAPARASVVDEADAPQNRDFQRKLQFIVVGLLAALAMGAGAGVLKELGDQNIRSAQDVSYITPLPILATVPHTQEDRLPQQVNVATIAGDFPGSNIADEYRHVVARIVNTAHGGRAIKVCVITSPARGDGKSTLACNLAIALAQAERRVLLVDVDSRNASVERYFGLRPGPGLAEMLNGEPMSHDPDRATPHESLFIMGPGLESRDLVERLASQEMRDFLEGAEELFDHVILDTPAVLLTSESRMLTHLADAVIVVAGAGVSTFGMLRRCLESLESSGAVILGLVVNAVRQAPGGYLRRNIDSYYSQHGGQPSQAPHAARRAAPSIVLVDKE